MASSLQAEYNYMQSGAWSEPESNRCPCRGSGWLLSDLDTWHACPEHHTDQRHPEEDPHCDCGCGTVGVCEAQSAAWQADAALYRVQVLAEKQRLREAVLTTPELVHRFESIQQGGGTYQDADTILAAAERRGVSILLRNVTGERIGIRRRYDANGEYEPVFTVDHDHPTENPDIPF